MMTKQEVSEIVAMAMESQGREVSVTDLMLWGQVIGDLPFTLAREAVVCLLRESDSFISHQSVRQRALALGAERVNAVTNPPQPPSNLSIEEYERWQRGWKMAAMTGQPEVEIERAGLAAIERSPEALPALSSAVPGVAVQTVAAPPKPLF